MPLLTPSPRDVEPIVFRQDSTGDKENTKSKVSSSKNTAYLSKYTNMLKSDIPFGHVQFTMERDAIDVSIIELVVAAHGCR